MKLRIVSDLHLEFWMGRIKHSPSEAFIPLHEDDKQSVLLIAGDLCESHRLINKNDDSPYMVFLKDISDRFDHVLYVMGNHDHYHGNIDMTFKDLKNIFEKYPNITILENNTFIYNDVAFIGATLWTDYDKSNKEKLQTAIINDFNGYISNKNNGIFKPEDSVKLHNESLCYIVDRVNDAHKNQLKPVVITHHAPSYMSCDIKYSVYPYNRINCCFMSNLDDIIKNIKPNLWVHGHVHDGFDYMLGDTRIVCNPVAYPGENGNNRFEPFKFVEV